MPDTHQQFHGIQFDPTSKASQLAATGAQYHVKGELDAARMHYDAALLLEPDNALALQNLAGILLCAMQYHSAECVARRAVRAMPDNPFALGNLGAAVMHNGRYTEGIAHMVEALKVAKTDPGIWHNLALSSYMIGKIDNAITAVKKSLEFQPDSPAISTDQRVSDLGIFTMASGDIVGGLEIYEARWRLLHKSRAFDLHIPEWQGESLDGKRLLLHHEQGFGDGIMLVRFVQDLEDLGAIVTLATPKPLMRLFEQIVDCVEWSDEYPGNFDFHSPMLSTMRWLDLAPDVISPEPYLKVPGWSRDFGPGLKVGICWESGNHNTALRERRRVVPLDLFFPILDQPNVKLISLQKGDAQKDIIHLGAESFILDPMSTTEDFYDTARVISELDVVVSVDSAVAHLAGALGKPVLMLGPYVRCWRWWGETNGLPWYKNMEIFRQGADKIWNTAMTSVAERLRGF